MCHFIHSIAQPIVCPFDIGSQPPHLRTPAQHALIGRTWTLVTSAAGFSARSFLGVARIESGLVVFGGYAGSGAFYQDLWLSEDGGFSWRQISALGPQPAARSAGRLISLNSGDSCLLISGWQRGYLGNTATSPQTFPSATYFTDAWVVPEV
jgi:hypothetical protein